MPLPIAHTLVSTSVFAAYRGGLSVRAVRDDYKLLGLFVFAGLFPDVDFVTLPFAGFGPHRGLSHSIIFTVLVSTLICVGLRAVRGGVTARLWLYLALAMTLHPVCDYFTPDLLETRGGVKLLYPFSDAYYESPVPVFMGIELRYLSTIFSFHTLVALAYETLLTGTLLLAVVYLKRLRPGTSAGAALNENNRGGR